MYKMFNEKRVKFSEDRKIKLIQTKPCVDYLTTEEYFKKEQRAFYRLYVMHPFEIIEFKTKNVKRLKVGDVVDVFSSDLKEFFELEEWFLVTFRNQSFIHPIENNYSYLNKDEANNEQNYLANLHSLYDCTIPLDDVFYFWLSWKGFELEYTHNNYDVSYYIKKENIEIAANILGFLRFSDKIAYKTFQSSLADAILKFIIISGNEPSYYEKNQARSSLRDIVIDLNKTVCEMNIIEPTYKSFNEYLAEKQEEAILENQQMEDEKLKNKLLYDKRKELNQNLLSDLNYKKDFFSEMKKI